MCKLQKASDSGSRCCRRQACRLHRCFCSPRSRSLAPLLFLSLTLPSVPPSLPVLSPLPLRSPRLLGDRAREEWGAIKATAVCFRLQNPGRPSVRQPQSSYLPGPSGKPHTLEEKYLICPLCKDQQSHKRQGCPGTA